MCTLEEIGIESLEPNVCLDSSRHRGILTRNEVSFEIFTAGTIIADRTELAALPSPGHEAPFHRDAGSNYSFLGGVSLEHRMIMVDPDDPNSEYLDFLSLPSDYMESVASPWVLKRVNRIRAYQKSGKKSDSATLLSPVRCKGIRADGMRCLAWSLPTALSKEYCRAHIDPKAMDSNIYAQERREAVQERLMQLIEPAVVALEEIVTNAGAPQVRLRAAETIMDRTLGKPGSDHNLKVEIEHKSEDPAVLIRNRLEKLAQSLLPAEIEAGDDEVVDAELIEDQTCDQEVG